MNVKNYLFLIVTIALFACSETVKTPSEELRKIELKNTNDVLPISSFVEHVDYLELKFPNEKIEIKEILELRHIQNDLIVKDRKSREISFLRFSKDGVFKNTIQGGALPRDITEYKNEFAVWSEKGVSTSSKEGKLSKTLFALHSSGNRFVYSRNSFYVLSESSPAFISKYSVDGKLQEGYLQGSAKYPVKQQEYSTIIELPKNTTHFFSPLKDTVYALSGNQLVPKYYFDCGTFPTYQEVLGQTSELNDSETLKYLHNNRHVVIKKFLENSNYIFIAYWFGSNSSYALINKNTWESTYFKLGINDLDGGIWDMPVYLSEDNILYVPLSNYQINGHKVLNKTNNEFEQQRSQFLANENRVIMLCQLK